jgi:hypothetical protein
VTLNARDTHLLQRVAASNSSAAFLGASASARQRQDDAERQGRQRLHEDVSWTTTRRVSATRVPVKALTCAWLMKANVEGE